MPTFIKLKALIVMSVLSLVSIFTLNTTAVADERPFGDVQILATVPFPPGFPEGIAVNGDKVYVAGPASFDTAGTPASKVFAYDIKTGGQSASVFANTIKPVFTHSRRRAASS